MELETQYSPSRWSPRLDKDAVIEAHVQATSEATHSAQMATQTLLNVPYGLSEGEKLDVYLPKDLSETFPLVLYIHGGYWQFLSKNVSGFAAWPLVTHGIALAAVGYDVAPKGQLEVMVRQVRRSVAFAVQQYTGISGVYLLGHSAGAHLAAMVLSTDWKEFGVVPNIKGAFLVSGVYDLEPITHTYVNDVLHMSREVAQWNSPLKCVPELENRRACQVLITVAQHDSPEFCRQSQEYFEALRAAGWSASLLNIADTDHFDVIEKLSQEDYLLTQVILQMILKG
ncbi:kynurenine formamidase isoform X2 [Hemicordylus capensis]|uniref:kynurenine formamidase isoform X2 n=1 Tax=Hemicordylus capensis TaxID=884348 RepID=UPI0023037565|nr:kynurenine formamidase isoform X2 [Hemicordylus capensis]XP_053156658.1 kynurenine formamidase isoform X2 [Hemicordylus capensis]